MVQKQKQRITKGGDEDVPLVTARREKLKSVVGSAENDDKHFGGGSDDEEEVDEFDQGIDFFKNKEMRETVVELDDTEDGDEFSAFYTDVKKSGQVKASKRKERYSLLYLSSSSVVMLSHVEFQRYTPELNVAQKDVLDPSAKRAASHTIIKNRGLVRWPCLTFHVSILNNISYRHLNRLLTRPK